MSDAERELYVPGDPSGSDRAAILRPLIAFNSEAAVPTRSDPLAVLIRDGEATVGGLWGVTQFDWLQVELLYVPEAMRGRAMGTAVLRRAEAIARERGCIGAWLDTFSFQARGFYEKLGYRLVGTVDDHPRGGARHFLQRRFA